MMRACLYDSAVGLFANGRRVHQNAKVTAPGDQK